MLTNGKGVVLYYWLASANQYKTKGKQGFEKKFEEQAQKIVTKKAEPIKEVKAAPVVEEVVEETNDEDLDFDDIFSVFKK